MKNKIYLFIIFLILLICSIVLIIYYSQDFKKQILFVDSLSIDDIDYDLRSGTFYAAEAKIGVINITNNGIFSEKYTSPLIRGCLIFDNLDLSTDHYLPNQVSISVLSNSSSSIKQGNYDYYSSYDYGSNQIEIPARQGQILYIVAKYFPRISESILPEFNQRIRGINLYVFENSDEEYYNFNCDNINNLNANKKILINLA